MIFFDPTTGLPYTRGFAQILRRNVEGGGRRDDRQHTNFRIAGGLRGDLNDVWSYDVYYLFGQTNFSDTYTNDFSVTRLTRALDVIDNPNTPGVDPVCRSFVNGTDLGCIPYDIFATGQIAPGSAVLNYLSTPGFQRGTNKQTVASASITGNLGGWGIQFPWAQEGVGIAIGVEYRKESLELLTDAAFSLLPSSDLAGQGSATLSVNGEFDVREAFAELRIPIVEESFIYNFSLEAGYRYSDYQIGARSVSTDTYKIGFDLSPVRDLRIRGAYNRAVRAPNIQELFAPTQVVAQRQWRSLLGCGAHRPARGLPSDGRQRRRSTVRSPATRRASITARSAASRPSIRKSPTPIRSVWFSSRASSRAWRSRSIISTSPEQCDPAVRSGYDPRHLRRATDQSRRSAASSIAMPPARCGGPPTAIVIDLEREHRFVLDLGHRRLGDLLDGDRRSWGGLNFNMVGTWLDTLEDRQRDFGGLRLRRLLRPDLRHSEPRMAAQAAHQLRSSVGRRPLGSVALFRRGRSTRISNSSSTLNQPSGAVQCAHPVAELLRSGAHRPDRRAL